MIVNNSTLARDVFSRVAETPSGREKLRGFGVPIPEPDVEQERARAAARELSRPMLQCWREVCIPSKGLGFWG